MNFKIIRIWFIFSIFSICTVISEEYQNKDPLLSTYKKDQFDGYSWKERKINYNISDQKLSIEKLVSTVWVKDSISEPWERLVFFKDNVFNLGSTQAGVMIFGAYAVFETNKVILIKDKSRGFTEPYNNFLNDFIILEFDVNTNNMFFQHSLKNKDQIFYAQGSEQKDGKIVKYNSEEISKLTKKIVAIDNVNARVEPNILSKKYAYSFYKAMYNVEISNGLILKGTVLELIGFIPKPVVIDNKKSNWYLVKIFNEESFEYVWVFGAYFENYIDNKKDEYKKILLNEIELKKN